MRRLYAAALLALAAHGAEAAPRAPSKPARQKLAPAKSAPRAGVISELEKQHTLVLGNPDNFAGTLDMHQALQKHLPKGLRVLTLTAAPLPAEKGAKKIPGVDSPWTRDYAPVFVRSPEGKVHAVDFKYHYKQSDRATTPIAHSLKVPVKHSSLSVEGGNILADGETVFMTRRVLKANADRNKKDIETELKGLFHAKKIEWMPELPEESTGHIDLYAKIVADKTVVVSKSMHPSRKRMLDGAANRFKKLGYKVLRVSNAEDPNHKSTPVAMSYANALIVNGTAFVPQYADISDKEILPSRFKRMSTADKTALETYKKAGLKVVGIASRDMVSFGGTVHCMTNTIPEEAGGI